MSKLKFETIKLERDANGELTASKEHSLLIKKLFQYVPDGNLLFVLNPKYVLSEDVLDVYRNKNHDFNFYNVTLPKKSLLEDHNYYWFFTQNRAFVTTYKKLKHDLSYIAKEYSVKNPSLYYFIVEEDANDCHLVRGIIKGTLKEGISIFLNPDHDKRVTARTNRSIFDKALSFAEESETYKSLKCYQTQIDEYLDKNQKEDLVK